MKYNSILETVGNTPVVKINKIFDKSSVWIKLERQNPGGSIKDRIALSMIVEAEKRGEISPGKTVLIEPTSGNTGIGLSLVAAVKGYRLILVMPESMTVERRKIMSSYGAEFVLTPREKGMSGAVSKAKELCSQMPDSWMPSQFDNSDNVKVHEETTAREILNDFPDGLDYIITGVGTGGHITAVAKVLKSKFNNLKVFAVEPEVSPVLSGGSPSPHPIQGIGAGFVPSILEIDLLDGILKVNAEQSFKKVQLLANKEGILAGISTGASLVAVESILKDNPSAKILTFNYDTGERYLSVDSLF